MSRPTATPIGSIGSSGGNQNNIEALQQAMMDMNDGNTTPVMQTPTPQAPSPSTYPTQPPIPSYEIPRTQPREFMAPRRDVKQHRHQDYVEQQQTSMSNSIFSLGNLLTTFKTHLLVGVLVVIFSSTTVRNTIIGFVPNGIGVTGLPTAYGYAALVLVAMIANMMVQKNV